MGTLPKEKKKEFLAFRRRLKQGGFKLVSVQDIEDAKNGIRKIAHIHMHSIYSIADAMCKPDEVAKRAKELGIETIVLTDHGVISGAIQMKMACDKHGIKFIPACEMYEAPDRTVKKDRSLNRHITMLPVNNDGWGALQYLIQDANTNGQYYDPRTDMKFIKDNNLGENIIATSGCLGGEIPQRILAGDYDSAKDEAIRRASIFHSYFLEIQDNGSREQEIVNQALIQMADETGIPLVYAKDVHYVFDTDKNPHHTLVAISRRQNVNECVPYPGTNTYHFAGAEEVYTWAHNNDIPIEALENAVKITEICNIDIELGKNLMPEYYFCENGHAPETYLRKLLYDNLMQYVERCAEKGIDIDVKTYIERIEHEYRIITSKNVASYFLILWDILLWSTNRKKWMSYPANAKWLNEPDMREVPHDDEEWEYEVELPNAKYAHYPEFYVGPGRGSAAGSMIAFLLDITRLDPIQYGLLFERFLNPYRKGMPDIDVDFPGDNHDMLIDFVAQRYGRDRTAQVKTFTYFKLKSAIGKICSALEERDPNDKRKIIKYGRSVAEEVKGVVNKIVNDANKLPSGKDVNYSDMMNIAINPDDYKNYENALPKAVEVSREFRQMMDKYPELNDNLQRIEGTLDSSSIHAGAVIISSRPLHLDCPTTIPDDKSKAVLPITMYDYPDCEEIGLLKMDLLRTATLRVISGAIDNAEHTQKKKIDIYDIGRDDDKVFDFISQGYTHGLFQINGGGITGYTRQVAPTKQSEVIDILALYRPGPLDAVLNNGNTIAQQYVLNGNRKVLKKYLDTLDDAMHDALGETRGQMVYQEQIMEISRSIAGYSPGHADTLRKIISKKKLSEIGKQYDSFVHGHKKSIAHYKKALDKWDEKKKVDHEGKQAIMVKNYFQEKHIPMTKEDLEGRIQEIEKDMKMAVIPGAVENGYDFEFADNLFRQIEAFGNYAFNKSHSACYADETYQTAWLKFYYPIEFMAALLTVRGGKHEDVLSNLQECKRMGIKILPPDINGSDKGFTPEKEGIRFGLVSIKDVGDSAVDQILAERNANGEFKSFDDFYNRFTAIKGTSVKRGVYRQLIKAGCFDFDNPNRYSLLNHYNLTLRGDKRFDGNEDAYNKAESKIKSNHSPYYDPTAFTEMRMLEMERDLIGMYVSGSPYEGLPYTPFNTMAISSRRDKKEYEIGGRVIEVRTIKTKKGDPMAFVKIETQLEPLEFTVFPDVYGDNEQHLYKDNIVVVRGYKEKSFFRGQEKEQFICSKILIREAKKLKKELGVRQEKPIEDKIEQKDPEKELQEKFKPKPKADPTAELFEDKPKKRRKKKRMTTVADYI